MLLRPLLRPTSLPSLTLTSRTSSLSSSLTSSFSTAARRTTQRQQPTTTTATLQWSRRPLLFAIGLSAGAAPFVVGRPLTRLDTSPLPSPSSPSSDAASFSTTPYTHSRDAKTPLTKDGKKLNPAAVKQISLGAILGLGAGVVLSAFSTSLTLLIGLSIVIWQVCNTLHYSPVQSRKDLVLTRSVSMRQEKDTTSSPSIVSSVMSRVSISGVPSMIMSPSRSVLD